MYVANHYVNVNGNIYMKDEIISEKMEEETIGWLMRAKAIREVFPHESQVPAGQEDPPAVPPESEDETEDAEAENETEDEEELTEEEPLEIDVMAGIVQDGGEPEKPEKPPARAKNKAKGAKESESKNNQRKQRGRSE